MHCTFSHVTLNTYNVIELEIMNITNGLTKTNIAEKKIQKKENNCNKRETITKP